MGKELLSDRQLDVRRGRLVDGIWRGKGRDSDSAWDIVGGNKRLQIQESHWKGS